MRQGRLSSGESDCVIYPASVAVHTGPGIAQNKRADSESCQPFIVHGGPWAIRTPDQLIKSQLLYRLS